MGDATRILGVELLADDIEYHRPRSLAGKFLGHGF
jgi:hypothetical protein